MQYRLYTVVDKELFCDPDNILLGVRDFFEISGEGEDKILQKLRACYPYASCENAGEAPSGVKRASVFVRNGRNDRGIRELYDVIRTLKPKNPITVRCGREFTFSAASHGELVGHFLRENVNSYVYSDKYLSSPNEVIPETEDRQIDSFCVAQYDELMHLKARLGITMSVDDLMCVQNYFISESREPTYTELKIIDSFFSESFRHTTFETILDSVDSEDPDVKKAWQRYKRDRSGVIPTLSDISRAAMELLPARENYAKVSDKLLGIRFATEDGDRVLFIKTESHNRSATTVPYDGAAGAMGCAIKDVFCALGYAYDSYRSVGRGKTDKSRKKSMLSAAGYADTASQLGIPCSKCKENVSDIYNDKQLEICSLLAVSARELKENAPKKLPAAGDKIYLIGGKTGADGSNCAHSSLRSNDSVGEYIPVTDAGELSAMQRLFVRPELADIAVAINDVGSGGLVCAMGEIVEGADMTVDAVKLKYGGLSCADIVLSESNERMIICIRSVNAASLENMCKQEGLECSFIATVNDDRRFTVTDGNGQRIVSLTRDFLLKGGSEKHLRAYVEAPGEIPGSEALKAALAPLGSVGVIKKLFGGKAQPDLERAYLISAGKMSNVRSENSHAFNVAANGSTTDTGIKAGYYDFSLRNLRYAAKRVLDKEGRSVCSAFACASLPEISGIAPYKGAYMSVVEAYLKLIAAGCKHSDIQLSLQEYLPNHANSSVRLGVSVASMLGAYDAEMELGIPSITGRISMGSELKDNETASSVTAFSYALCDRSKVIPSALNGNGTRIVLLTPMLEKEYGVPRKQEIMSMVETVKRLQKDGRVRSMACVNGKSACTVLMEMCRCERKGVAFDPDGSLDTLFGNSYCSLILEVSGDGEISDRATVLGYVTDDFRFSRASHSFSLEGVVGSGEKRPARNGDKNYLYLKRSPEQGIKVKPAHGDKIKVVIVDTGYTVSQNEIKELFAFFGAEARIVSVKNGACAELIKLLKKADILWLPDSLGDSALISALLSEPKVAEELRAMIERKGLIYGWGSSAESLAVSGLLGVDNMKVSFVRDKSEMVNEAAEIRVVSSLSPFTAAAETDAVYKGYVTGKRLRMLIVPEYADELAKQGRIVTQYSGKGNSAGSTYNIDAICSENGLVLGQLSRAMSSKDALPIVRSAITHFSTYSIFDGAIQADE